MTFDVHALDSFLLIGSLVTLLAILAVQASSRVGLPSLLIYLLMGVLLGEGGLGIPFEDFQLAHALGFAALVVILAEGGLTTDFAQVRPAMPLGVVLATVGVAVSILVMAAFGHYLLGLSWELALLLGAVCSPTDSAAVFSVLRMVPLPRRLTAVLEAESGLNDAPTVVVVTLLSTGAMADWGVPLAVLVIVAELVGGVLIGILVGLGGTWVMRRAALPASGLYPIAVISLAMLAYGAAAGVHASGFAAVYLAGLVLGNQELPHRAATRSFAEGAAWLSQIGLFVMLGLLLSPGRIDLEVVGIAVVAGLALTFVARPASVVVSALTVRNRHTTNARDLTFLSWAGLRGAVPIVLTTIPLSHHVDHATRLFDIVFVMVVIFTVVTGPTLPTVARWLGLGRNPEPLTLEMEVAPLERIAADMLQVTITERSRMHGVEVGELRLPPGSSVSLVIRGARVLVPELRTVLRAGDDLLVVTTRKQREATERRLRSVSRGGRLAQWLADDPG